MPRPNNLEPRRRGTDYRLEFQRHRGASHSRTAFPGLPFNGWPLLISRVVESDILLHPSAGCTSQMACWLWRHLAWSRMYTRQHSWLVKGCSFTGAFGGAGPVQAVVVVVGRWTSLRSVHLPTTLAPPCQWIGVWRTGLQASAKRRDDRPGQSSNPRDGLVGSSGRWAQPGRWVGPVPWSSYACFPVRRRPCNYQFFRASGRKTCSRW
jgi:hypothetical protein